jgi:hypothetical protein
MSTLLTLAVLAQASADASLRISGTVGHAL